MSTCHQATRSSGFLRRSGARSSSPFTYGDIKNGTLAEVHDIGELWAATLWDVRNGVNGAGGVGAAVIEQLVVSGMKLTPCNPTMLQARDGILQADVNVFSSAHRCAIWAAFAHRLMGTGASSPGGAPARSTRSRCTSRRPTDRQPPQPALYEGIDVVVELGRVRWCI